MTGSGRELVPVPRGRGRPSIYSEDIADEICERLSQGSTLIRIVREDRDGNARFRGEFPDTTTIYDWADPSHRGHRPDFSLRFARAKLEQQRTWLEECVEIANTTEEAEERSYEHGPEGVKTKRVIKDATAHRMLKIKTRLDVIARMNPLLWSERLALANAQAAQLAGDPSAQQQKTIIEGGLPDREPDPPAPRDDENETASNE